MGEAYANGDDAELFHLGCMFVYAICGHTQMCSKRPAWLRGQAGKVEALPLCRFAAFGTLRGAIPYLVGAI